jgi:hypothetical protein
MAGNESQPRYVRPGWFTNHVFNPLVALLTRAGLSVWGSRELRVGRRTEAFRATDLSDGEEPPVLRAYLKRWKLEVGAFFNGVSADSSDDDLRRISPDHPVFRIESASAS